MPQMEAEGMSVDRTFTPESEKHSNAPERSWENMSLSPPSWLLGNSCKSNLPLVSCLIASAALRACTLSGWVSGTLVPHLKTNSAAPAARRAGTARPIAVLPASIMRVKRRREMFRAMISSCCALSDHLPNTLPLTRLAAFAALHSPPRRGFFFFSHQGGGGGATAAGQ